MKNSPMLDKRVISQRFFECHSLETPYQLAKKLGVHPPLVYRWHEGDAPVPWRWLKLLVDEQGLTWDWLIEGREPKFRKLRKNEIVKPLERHDINHRFIRTYSYGRSRHGGLASRGVYDVYLCC
jgi:hypothetical protein